MLTRRRFIPPTLTGDWGADGPRLLKAISDYLLSLEQKGALAITEAEINGGTIDGAVIGGTTPAAGTFTTVYGSTSGAFGASSSLFNSAVLAANRSVASTGSSFDAANAFISLQNTNGTAGNGTYISNADSASHGNAYIGFVNVDHNYAGAIVFGTASTGAATYGERMRIDSSGNVGIGTTPARGRLEVLQSSDAVAGGIALVNSGVTVSYRYWIDGSGLLNLTDGASANILKYNAGTGLLNLGNGSTFHLTTAGNVGIGVAPSYKLHVGSGQIAAPDGSAAAPAYTFASSGNSDTGAYLSAADTYSIACGGVLVASFVQGTGLTAYSSIELLSGSANGRIKIRSSAHSTSPGTLELQPSSGGSVWAGVQSATSTSATDGFLYIPTCAGTPTGTPTTASGLAPLIVDTTNHKLYFYSGGSWRNAGP